MRRKRDPQAELKADLDEYDSARLKGQYPDPTTFSRGEIFLRHLTKSTLRLEILTRSLKWLTVVLAILTAVLVAAEVPTILKALRSLVATGR